MIMNGATRLVAFAVTICALVTIIDAINILDFFDLGKEQRNDGNTPGEKNCLCRGPSCICCVDFNLTLIDLGGPGCVRLKYLSQDLGFAVNISYGKAMLYSETVKGPNPRPTCLNLLFSRLAQLCARFTELAPTADGLRGCLQLEPLVFGESQFEFPVGCFRSGPEGMKMEDPKPAPEIESTDENDTESEEQQNPAIDTAAIIQAVNISAIAAVEGLNFFSNLLGLNFGGANATEIIDEYDEEDDEEDSPAADGSDQSGAPVAENHPAKVKQGRNLESKYVVKQRNLNDLV